MRSRTLIRKQKHKQYAILNCLTSDVNFPLKIGSRILNSVSNHHFKPLYQGFLHVLYGQSDVHIPQYHLANQNWWHVSHSKCLVLLLPPKTAIFVKLRQYSKTCNWKMKNKKQKKAENIHTAVATRIGLFPERNWWRASSLSLCDRSPWILVQAYPSWYKKSSKESAPFLVSTKTKVRESVPEKLLMRFFFTNSNCIIAWSKY